MQEKKDYLINWIDLEIKELESLPKTMGWYLSEDGNNQLEAYKIALQYLKAEQSISVN